MLLSASAILAPLRRTVRRARASKVGWILNWRLLLALVANLLFWGVVIRFFVIR